MNDPWSALCRALHPWLAERLDDDVVATLLPADAPLRRWAEDDAGRIDPLALLDLIHGNENGPLLLALLLAALAREARHDAPGDAPLAAAARHAAAWAAARRARRDDRAYDVFVSYCRRDAGRVMPIVARVKDHGLRVFLDTEAIAPGDDILAALQSAIGRAPTGIVFVSRDYVVSPWALRELEILAREEACLLLPVLLDDVPLPASIGTLCTIDLRLYRGLAGDPQLGELDPLIRVCLSRASRAED